MAIQFAVHKLRKTALRLHREYEALCVFSNMLTTSDRKRIEIERIKLSSARKAELIPIMERLKHAIAEHRKKWGFRVPNSEIVEILGKVESAPKGELPRMSKAAISDICTGYSKYWIIFDDLPAHTLIEIDPGTARDKPNQISWFLLEAAVFEDMCALFNQAKKLEGTFEPHGSDKVSVKTHGALLRATVLAAFHFVEAYLNGLAFDHYISKQHEISENTKSLLLDWDPLSFPPSFGQFLA